MIKLDGIDEAVATIASMDLDNAELRENIRMYVLIVDALEHYRDQASDIELLEEVHHENASMLAAFESVYADRLKQRRPAFGVIQGGLT